MLLLMLRLFCFGFSFGLSSGSCTLCGDGTGAGRPPVLGEKSLQLPHSAMGCNASLGDICVSSRVAKLSAYAGASSCSSEEHDSSCSCSGDELPRLDGEPLEEFTISTALSASSSALFSRYLDA
jgi:hypothetical protein